MKLVDLSQKFKLKDYKFIPIHNEPWDMCVLENDYILTANYFEANLTLFDRNFQIIRVIDAIDNFTFNSSSITINESLKRIFISDFKNNRLISCNYEFKFIAATNGDYGKNFRQLDGPSGICCKNNSIYLCDYNNERIQKLTVNLNFETSYAIYIKPFFIKILNTIAAIKSDDDSRVIYLYNLNDFSICYKYDEYDTGCLFIFNSYLYQFDYLNMKICSFNELGELKECDEIEVDGLDDIDFDDWTCMVQLNDKLLISPGSSFKFILI